MIEQAKFTYSSLGNAFEKQIKTIEDPGEKTNKSTWRALEEHRKQLVKSSIEKKPLTLLKQKEIFKELSTERMGEIQILDKQIDFKNSIYYFKSKSDSKDF